MTLQELHLVLKQTGLPVKYSHFDSKEKHTIPYITYVEESRNNIQADDVVWHKEHNIRIELYTKNKDTKTEILLEDVLDNAGMYYTAEDVGFIESENLYEVIYYITI